MPVSSPTIYGEQLYCHYMQYTVFLEVKKTYNLQWITVNWHSQNSLLFSSLSHHHLLLVVISALQSYNTDFSTLIGWYINVISVNEITVFNCKLKLKPKTLLPYFFYCKIIKKITVNFTDFFLQCTTTTLSQTIYRTPLVCSIKRSRVFSSELYFCTVVDYYYFLLCLLVFAGTRFRTISSSTSWCGSSWIRLRRQTSRSVPDFISHFPTFSKHFRTFSSAPLQLSS